MKKNKQTKRLAEHDPFGQLLEMIQGIRVCMLTTQQSSGDLTSRPMTTLQAQDPGVLWFFMAQDSRKANEMSLFSRVNLAYTDPGAELYVSVSGNAELIHDRSKAHELWNPLLKAWFPKGLDDPNLTLLRVDVTQAEYWDAPTSKMVQLFGMIKAAVTGEPYNQGENQHLNLGV